LPEGVRPHHFASGLDPKPWVSQLEAHANLLANPQGSNRLHRQPVVIEVANDSAIGLVESNVG
jgi:hypothetical protein